MCSVEIYLLFRGFGSLLLFGDGVGEDTGGEMEMIKWGLHLLLLILGEVAWYNGNSFGLIMKRSEFDLYICMYKKIT